MSSKSPDANLSAVFTNLQLLQIRTQRTLSKYVWMQKESALIAPRINGEVFGASFFHKACLGQAAILPLVVPGMFHGVKGP